MTLKWLDRGLDFNPNSCPPFYLREEVLDQKEDFEKKKFYWMTRLEDVRPQMWQIYIEGVYSQNEGYTFTT